MTEGVNRQWTLASRPEGYPAPENFALVESPIKDPETGEVLLQTMWMLTDFTAENGATLVVPGSHLKGRPPEPGEEAGEVAATGHRGSLLVWHGTLWHRAAANTSTGQHRLGANAGYIPRFIHRPREEWPLLRSDLYESFPASLRQLLERSVE